MEPIATREVPGAFGGLPGSHVRWSGGDRDRPAALFDPRAVAEPACWDAQVGGPLGRGPPPRDLRQPRPRHVREARTAPSTTREPRLWADDRRRGHPGNGPGPARGGRLVLRRLRRDRLRPRPRRRLAIAGINLVGGAVMLKRPAFDHIGPGFLQNAPPACTPDLAIQHRRHRTVRPRPAPPVPSARRIGTRRCARAWWCPPRSGER